MSLERNDYPPESQKMDLFGHLEELRRRILIVLVCLVVASVFSFSVSGPLLRLARRPLAGILDQLIFVSPTEVFVAYLKVAVLGGVLLTVPILLYHLWAFVAPAFPAAFLGRDRGWITFAVFCFGGGVFFSFQVALPAALKFLVNLGQEVAVAQITLGNYISFFVMFVLLGGLIFEIPVVIGLVADAGIVSVRLLKAQRKFALVGVLLAAAILTPTSDIFNLMIFAVPMMVLYEVGILIAAGVESRRGR